MEVNVRHEDLQLTDAAVLQAAGHQFKCVLEPDFQMS
jgi:hypothetical protein